MTTNSLLARIAGLAVLLNASAVHAADAGPPIFSFNGFGTIGAVHSSERNADYTNSIFKPNGAGYTRNWSADVDSLLAGQVTANITPQLSAVVQVVAQQRYDNSYTPYVEWANVKYQFTPDFHVRAGRVVLPAFLYSETRNVAYTYPWVRPPQEVYRLLPITSNDGVDVGYRLHLGGWTHTLQANAGRNEARLVGDAGVAESSDSWGLSEVAESGPLIVRVTYQTTRLTLAAFNSLADAFRQFGPQGAAIADRYSSDHRSLSVVGVGASYDPGDWFVTAEWGGKQTASFIGNATAWYVSGGHRIGTLTPYITYAQARADNLSDPGLNAAAGAARGLNAALNSILSSKVVQKTASIGGRWDFMRNAALKMQYDHTRIGAGSTGVLRDTQPGFQLGGKVDVFSATLDFVF